jgi:endonuclease/exonuclease/phosphatase family metal-dependent hydrolase
MNDNNLSEVLPMPAPIIRVMSYNIHVGNPPSQAPTARDLPAIARVINREKPDLVALSEVDDGTERSGCDVNQTRIWGGPPA